MGDVGLDMVDFGWWLRIGGRGQHGLNDGFLIYQNGTQSLFDRIKRIYPGYPVNPVNCFLNTLFLKH